MKSGYQVGKTLWFRIPFLEPDDLFVFGMPKEFEEELGNPVWVGVPGVISTMMFLFDHCPENCFMGNITGAIIPEFPTDLSGTCDMSSAGIERLRSVFQR